MKKPGMFLALAVMAVGMVFMGCPSPVDGDDPVTPTGFDNRVSAPKAADYTAWNAKIAACIKVPETVKTPELPKVHFDKWVKACDNPVKTPATKINIWVKKDWADPADAKTKKITVQLWQSIGDAEPTKVVKAPAYTDLSGQKTLSYDADTGAPGFNGPVAPGRQLYAFTDLPAYTAAGELITYYVQEIVPAGYIVSYPEPVDVKNIGADGLVKITEQTERVEFSTVYKPGGDFYYIVRLVNTAKPAIEYTQLTVNKVWSDNDDAADLRPASIIVTLKAKVGGVSADVASATLTAPGWSHTFADLLVEDENHAAITYSVEEVIPLKYNTSQVTENKTVTITNSYTPPPPPFQPPNGRDDVTALWVKKDWGSEKNRDTSLVINLYQQIGDGAVTLFRTAKWADVSFKNVPLLLYYEGTTPKFASSDTPGRDLYQFLELPATANGGTTEIYYYVEETGVTGYTLILPWAKDKANLTTFSVGGVEKTGIRVNYGETQLEYMNRFYHVVLLQNDKIK
ncbi:MAG: Cna B-type domain-containing protein [Treponema sp.]|jgi:hypothetical protein|nr:Cna B-type domain-containing protein [Treponema sp.]